MLDLPVGATFHKISNKVKSIRKLLQSIAKLDASAFIAIETQVL